MRSLRRLWFAVPLALLAAAPGNALLVLAAPWKFFQTPSSSAVLPTTAMQRRHGDIGSYGVRPLLMMGLAVRAGYWFVRFDISRREAAACIRRVCQGLSDQSGRSTLVAGRGGGAPIPVFWALLRRSFPRPCRTDPVPMPRWLRATTPPSGSRAFRTGAAGPLRGSPARSVPTSKTRKSY